MLSQKKPFYDPIYFEESLKIASPLVTRIGEVTISVGFHACDGSDVIFRCVIDDFPQFISDIIDGQQSNDNNGNDSSQKGITTLKNFPSRKGVIATHYQLYTKGDEQIFQIHDQNGELIAKWSATGRSNLSIHKRWNGPIDISEERINIVVNKIIAISDTTDPKVKDKYATEVRNILLSHLFTNNDGLWNRPHDRNEISYDVTKWAIYHAVKKICNQFVATNKRMNRINHDAMLYLCNTTILP